MFIKKITLENYGIYHGPNHLDFSKKVGKNVFVISGNNGFGKTTLLTSLVWCLYGKLMIDVDDKFRKEIYESGGYKKFASNTLNRLAKSEGCTSYKVSIILSDIFIPALPCNEVTISRTFNAKDLEDTVKIFIDGSENELTRSVGHEIFINDFILPKEVAKFFFFDAEKIVSLAEIKSVEEKRSLSKAYSEVLGIKKYEDLKAHLEDLRIRFRRDSASEKDKNKFEELQKEITQSKKLIEEYETQIFNLQDEKNSKKQASDQYQIKLIREGNSMSVSELNALKKQRNKLTEAMDVIKGKLKDLLELAPFAIVGNKITEVKDQLTDEVEFSQNNMNPALIKRKSRQVEDHIINNAKALELSTRQARKLAIMVSNSIMENFSSRGRNSKNFQVLLNFSDTEKNEFDAIYSNLKSAFNIMFRQLVHDYKVNKSDFSQVIRKISNAESKENDLVIKEIRSQKDALDNRIEAIDNKFQGLNQEIGGLQKEIAIKSKLVSELSKKINIGVADKAKDEVAERLIEELTLFITKLKTEKKQALEFRLKDELNNLMHKSSFVSRVEVEISEDIIDINLFNKRRELIIKDGLSKGEQQLYATALLKALVDESNIKFSVFIDSPLQKFDKTHSQNIISNFYPQISEQVVLFPLLEKELSESEYQSLLPKINTAFLIANIDEDRSTFIQVEPQKLFKDYKESNEHIYTHQNIRSK
ncbi:MAG: hypothetical protein JWO09_1137 [Bacteroidetes bacterium]|nr:hypothetical protein [Bacteroidota bacterium]